MESNELTATNIAAEIKSILTTNAQKCKLRTKNISRKNKDLSAPWFDKDCIDIKSNLRKLGNLLKKDPSNKEIRNDLLLQKRVFKKTVTHKKNSYQHDIFDEMTTKKNEKKQKDFWKLLGKLSPKKTNLSDNMSHDTLSIYFESLLNSNSHVELPPDNNERGKLDHSITLDELMKASSILKPGKSVGIDNISNEMISCLLNTYPKVILKLFNSILTNTEMVPH